MSQWLLSLIFAVGIVLAPTKGQPAYDQLSDLEKEGVNLALLNLNSHSSTVHHFQYFKSLTKSVTESQFDVRFITHNFYAKATTCSKGTVTPSFKGCSFRNDRPLVDCLVCYKTHADKIGQEPKPYINCIRKPALTEDIKNRRKEQCQKMHYSIGTITLLGSARKE